MRTKVKITIAIEADISINKIPSERITNDVLLAANELVNAISSTIEVLKLESVTYCEESGSNFTTLKINADTKKREITIS